MKLRIKKPNIFSQWVVEAHGYSGDDDARNREIIYQGSDEFLAKRTYLEASALAQAFPSGRGVDAEFEYSTLVAPLFEGLTHVAKQGKPFAWASDCWSRDATCEWNFDATIDGAEIFWIDEHGAKRAVYVALDPDEKKIVANAPTKPRNGIYDLGALIASLEQWEIQAVASLGRPGKGPLVL